MILHYIRISLRNLNKYKTQTAISISAMAVSLTLMAIVASILMPLKPVYLLGQKYADRTVQFNQIKEDGRRFRYAIPEKLSLILSHPFKSVEEIHYYEFGEGNPMHITANSGQDNERSLYNESFLIDSSFLKFQGIKSVYTGKEIGKIAEGETVLTAKLAKKLFGKENPIGKSVNVSHPHSVNKSLDRPYVVKDVMEDPAPKQPFFRLPEGIFICADEELMKRDAECFFILKDGASPESLAIELNELLGENDQIKVEYVKDIYSYQDSLNVRKAIILFLFLFVLVAFSNYMRQQTQLFRLREREVALRRCIGCLPSSMFILFSCEILIVLLITLVLTIILITLLSAFLTSNYTLQFEYDNYSLKDAVPVALIAIAILIVISLIVVAITVRSIRLDQTGLALRMKPLPKHRIRNIGLTLQLTISMVFTCITVLFFISGSSIKESFGIPDDMDRYKKYLTLRMHAVSDQESDAIYNKIEALKSVEKVFKFIEVRRFLPFNEDQTDFVVVNQLFQKDMDGVDFHKLKSEDIAGNVNPDKFILVSKAFRQTLIDKNLWNGKTVTVPEYGDYEVKGVFDCLPFEMTDDRNDIVVYDTSEPMAFAYDRIILPKAGMEKEAISDIRNAIREVLPSRIDIETKSYYDVNAFHYEVDNAMIAVIYILSAISVVMTMAAIYAGVSLDTRRRRKEMALRKLNGAGRKIIAMIFIRTYIWIVGVAALISLPVCFIVFDSILKRLFESIEPASVFPAYLIGLLLILAVTTCTIVWKIRDIMHADPIEYLKE
ncbi:MAG: ABC transporter permease [Muribaculaceae bacterium]|nr:ABC transporter permease [Muribaculaceae bacterium]